MFRAVRSFKAFQALKPQKPEATTLSHQRFSSFVQSVARSMAKPKSTTECPLTFAEQVLDKVDRKFYSEPNVGKLKARVDLEQRIEQIENELRQQISKSLKKAQEKLIVLLAATNATHKHLQAMQAFHGKNFHSKEHSLILDFNRLVNESHQARWALIVQRQCAGFTIRNHELVCGLYPIPEAIN